jgi:glycosyltransferase involved in cell wall biosynthesis
VPSVIGAIDIGVLCSQVEAFPLSILEYMAAGIPVVSTDVGSIRDIVSDGTTGRVVEGGDPHAFGAAVSTLVRDSALRFRMGSAGAARARTEFSVDRMVERTEALLEEVIGR